MIWKLKVLLYVLLASAIFISAWKIQGLKIEKLKSEIVQLTEINRHNAETVKKMKLEMQNLKSEYESRLKRCVSFATRLQELEKMKGGIYDMGQGQKSDSRGSGELIRGDLLDRLNSMFSEDSQD